MGFGSKTDTDDDQELGFATPWNNIPKTPWAVMDDTPKREPKRKKTEDPVQKVISGIGIENQEIDTSQNEKILETLNMGNRENLEEDEKRIRQRKLQEEEEAEKYRQEYRQNVLRERYEAEQREKAEREQREAEEAAE